MGSEMCIRDRLQQESPELWRRSELVLTTKIFWGGTGVNERGLSRKHMREGLLASLERLQTEYVDLVFCHRPDPYTPTETVVRGMTDLVRGGLATAWGTSEWSAQQITEAVWLARSYGLEPPQFEQPQYNMFHRNRVEEEYHPLYAQPYSMGTTIWSPLASGILTGKYNDAIPEGSRMTQKGYEWLSGLLAQHHANGNIEKVRALTDYATTHLDCSMTQLALAWCIKNKHVSTVLLGATHPDQLAENLDALAVVARLTDEHMTNIEAILGNAPEGYMGYGGRGMRGLDTI